MIRAYIAGILELMILIITINTAGISKVTVSKEVIYNAENFGEIYSQTNTIKAEHKSILEASAERIQKNARSKTPPIPQKIGGEVTTAVMLKEEGKDIPKNNSPEPSSAKSETEETTEEIIADATEEITKTVTDDNTGVPTESEQKSGTYYDTLTAEEISLIEVTIQHEVGGLSKTYKRLIAELIYNRLKSDIYPDTVKEMLFQENQFIGIESWYYPAYPVDDETKAVVKEVFSKDSTTHDALAYYNPALSCEEAVIWFEYSGDMQFLFDYSEENWGIVYTTRFFK